MAKTDRSNTVTDQPRKRGKGRPFKKNDPTTGEVDPRINRTGRPKSFDQLRALGQQLGNEIVVGRDGKPLLAPDGQPMTATELIMRQMMQDEKQRLDYLHIAYGRPPLKQEVTGKDGAPLGSATLDLAILGKHLSDGELLILQQASEIIERAQHAQQSSESAEDTGD